ncbi:MAG TPA: SCO family protein [Bacteroidota bacterium]|nr:SCO family protein [Bacteroidota bacterium]
MRDEIMEKLNAELRSQCIRSVILFCLATALGCSKKEEKREVDIVTFPLKGEVVSVDMEKRRVMVAHEEIPNYMMAMTMPFKVKDTTLLLGLEVGDSIRATLNVSRTESWLEEIVVIGKDESRQAIEVRGTTFKKLWKEGDALPNVELTNKDGRKIKISDFRGKILAFTFIYTRCPLPDFCIRMSDHFSQVQRELKKDLALAGHWQLLTISFDPAHDKPEVLKKYGENYGADFTTWEFATGSETTIRTLADGLDLTLEDDEGGLIAHNLRTVILDKNGVIVSIIKGNDWTPADVVNKVRSALKLPA